MSARIIVSLIMEYAGNDADEYDRAMENARQYVTQAGDDVVADSPIGTVRVVDVQVSG